MNAYKEAIEEHVQKTLKKREKAEHAKRLREFEDKFSTTHIGSVEIDNDLKVRADICSDTDKWEYIVRIYYRINGKKRILRTRINMNSIEGPKDMTGLIHATVLEDLAKRITAEVFEQNQQTIAAASKEFVG
tara:strand:- start:1838 stop:2233 length:396 start_codon:yes stop_codon:yes gene_type:complete